MDFSFLYQFEWLIIELIILAILFNELRSLRAYEKRKKKEEEAAMSEEESA